MQRRWPLHCVLYSSDSTAPTRKLPPCFPSELFLNFIVHVWRGSTHAASLLVRFSVPSQRTCVPRVTSNTPNSKGVARKLSGSLAQCGQTGRSPGHTCLTSCRSGSRAGTPPQQEARLHRDRSTPVTFNESKVQRWLLGFHPGYHTRFTLKSEGNTCGVGGIGPCALSGTVAGRERGREGVFLPQ